jgi:hypothetical protein
VIDRDELNRKWFGQWGETDFDESQYYDEAFFSDLKAACRNYLTEVFDVGIGC